MLVGIIVIDKREIEKEINIKISMFKIYINLIGKVYIFVY